MRKTVLSSQGAGLVFCYEVPRVQDQGLSPADFLFSTFSFLRFLNNPSRVSHYERQHQAELSNVLVALRNLDILGENFTLLSKLDRSFCLGLRSK